MKAHPLALAFWLFLGAAIRLSAAENQATRLIYVQPAVQWSDALPIGNGDLSALVFGGIPDERIQFNKSTPGNGRPHDAVRASADKQLGKIRRLLAEGKTNAAEKIAREKFLGDPLSQNTRPALGDLRLHFIGHENAADFQRDLDFDSAMARTIYRVDEVVYRRAAFASYPDHAIILRLTADHHGRLSFTVKLDSPLTNSQTRAVAPDTLALAGPVEAGGGRFEARVKVLNVGGRVSTDGNVISVQDADSATLFLTAAIRVENSQGPGFDPADRCAQDLAKVGQRKFETILADHLADYRGPTPR
jgi:alpha-L-fucosidase 2